MAAKRRMQNGILPCKKVLNTSEKRVKFYEMDFTQRDDPHALFDEWLEEARQTEPNDPNAFALATVDAGGMPDVRTVLLKGHDEKGFVFYTNFESAKGRQIRETMKAALGFHWKSSRRQIRARGTIETVSDEEADFYFASRHPQSRRGAWASQQSRPLESRDELVARLEHYQEKFPDDDAIPRPPYWSGFRIVLQSIEFWQNGEFRLHDRIRFTEDGKGGWERQRLNP